MPLGGTEKTTGFRFGKEISTQVNFVTWRWDKNPTKQQRFTHFSHKKTYSHESYILFYLKCHSLPIKLQFSCNHLTKASFVAVVIPIAIISFFKKFRTYVMLILINQYFLNNAFRMTKTLNVQNYPKQIFIPPTIQCYLENPVSLNACFPLFRAPCFTLNFMKFHVTPL